MPQLPVDEQSEEEYTPTSYTATLMSPLFYSSGEGRTIKTQPIISATALIHAIGYTLPDIDLSKRYVHRGSETTKPSYNHLRDLDIFVSDMTPVAIRDTENTFRSVDYTGENWITTDDKNVAGELDVKPTQGYPQQYARSSAGHHSVRRYTGISPQSEYRFTIWTPESVDVPKEIRFRAGISRSGEFVSRRKQELSESISLNAYLLSNVYDDPVKSSEILSNAKGFEKGNDPRLTHYQEVDREWVDSVLFGI